VSHCFSVSEITCKRQPERSFWIMKRKRKINHNVPPLFQEKFPEVRRIKFQNVKRIMQLPVFNQQIIQILQIKILKQK
jgi:hypothetical protein